jgi:hypothetical protein
VFSSAAAAKAFFTDDAWNLGTLATGGLSGNPLSLQAVLTVTTNVANSGFYGELIVGDPPKAKTAKVQAMAQAMAGFGATEAGVVPTARAAGLDRAPMLLAPRAFALA